MTVFTKKTITRTLVYLSGLCILALGLTLSTKADLGVSPIIAVSFCISKITGAALSLDMRLIANPGDGLVQAVSDRTGIDLGLSKNIVDITCVSFTCILSMAAAHRILGVGFGTVIAMLGIGRVIALINKLFGERLREITYAGSGDQG